MKILQVIDKLNVGGAEKIFIMLTSLLAESEVQVDVLLFDDSGSITWQLDNRLTVHNLNRKSKYALLSLKTLNSICSGYDIVHVHMRHCFTYTALAKRVFGGKYKILLHDHYGDIDINQHVSFGLKLFKPDVYIGVSTSLKQWAIEKLRLEQYRIHVLSNVIKPVSYTLSSANEPDTCMIANIRRTKNIEFAISLFKKLNWPLTIYGRINDVDYYNELIQLVGDANNIEIVSNVNGFENIRTGHNFAIHTALSETGPLVLLEYMSAGIPFIAYRTGEIATVVSGDLGTLFLDTFNEEVWISRMKEVMNDESLREKLQQTFNKYFDTKKYLADCVQIYHNVHC